MKSTTRLLLVTLAAIAAFASSTAETIKLKIPEAIAVLNALASLDAGQTKLIQEERDGKQVEKPIQLPYQFSGSTRWAIARDISALKPHAEAFEKTRVDLIKQITGGGSSIDKSDTDKLAKFYAELTPVAEKDIKVDLQRLKPEDLKLDQNAISSAVLLALEPIIQN